MSERAGQSPRRVPVWLIVLAGVLAVGAGYGARKLLGPSPRPAPETKPAFEFDLASLDGSTVSAADYAGRVVVVDFWATWCSPCRLQAEILHSLKDSYQAADVSFVAINVGEPEALVRSFVERDPFSYPVLMDPTQTVSDRYGVLALPTVLVVAPDGTIAFSRIGVSSWAEIAAAIDRVLGAAG